MITHSISHKLFIVCYHFIPWFNCFSIWAIFPIFNFTIKFWFFVFLVIYWEIFTSSRSFLTFHHILHCISLYSVRITWKKSINWLFAAGHKFCEWNLTRSKSAKSKVFSISTVCLFLRKKSDIASAYGFPLLAFLFEINGTAVKTMSSTSPPFEANE